MTAASGFRRRRIDAFLQLAREEMRAAATLLDALPRQSAFFQQQCVEKLLRATLEAGDIQAGPTYNLRTLADLLPREHKLRMEFLAFEELSSAATRYRYPSGSGEAPKVSTALVRSRQERLAAFCTTVEDFLRPPPAK